MGSLHQNRTWEDYLPIWKKDEEDDLTMPKAMISASLQRQKNEPWGFVIVGGKDQALTVKLGRIKPYSPAEKAGLQEWDYVFDINGKEGFEMSHNEIVGMIKNAGTSLTLTVERGDHIVPNFEEIWPSNKDKIDKNKRHLIGSDYYLDAMQNNGLKGHIPQPDNFTTVGKLGIEINQYNCPIEVYDEAVIEEMTEDREMLTNPELVEKRKDLQTTRMQHDNPLVQQKMQQFDPRKSNVLTTLAAEERDKAASRT